MKISRAVADLCISKKYLSAFEKNDLSQFPDNAYAIGFLKNYADYLGLDQGSLVKELKSHLRFEPLDVRACRPLDRGGAGRSSTVMTVDPIWILSPSRRRVCSIPMDLPLTRVPLDEPMSVT